MKKLFYSFTIMALAALVFNSCEDVPAPFGLPSSGGDTPTPTVEPTGSGTAADPYNVAAVIEYAQTLEIGEESPSNIYIKGKIASIKEEYTTQYGNATFTISDDGSAKNTFTIYRALYLNNKKFASGDTQIQVGDDVVVCGIVTNYNGTLETQQNKAYLYSLNGEGGGGGGGGGQTGEAKGSGTLDDPYNPAGAAAAVKNLTWTSNDNYETTGDVYVKGKISRIAEKGTFTEGGTYGNASFYISEDGSNNGEFYCFRILYLGNKKFESGKTDIKVGDEVIVCGQLMNYRGNTPETVAGKAYLYSLNGKTEGGGGGGGGTSEVKAVSIADFNAAPESTDVWYQLKGTVKNLKDGDQYGNFDIEDNTGSVYVYGLLAEKGGEKKKFQELAAAKGIKNGSVITIIGNRGSYNDKIEVLNAYLVSVEGEGGGGGGGGTDTGAGSYSNPYSVTQAIAAGSGSGVYVKGFIVGYVDGQAYESGAHFDASGEVKTNILIAASASETDVTKCMPVQLPSGAVRNGINLADNPGFLYKEVLLYGNIEAYFKVPGIKSVSYAEVDGKSFGTKASVKRRR